MDPTVVLAHDAALFGVPFEFGKLFYGDDPDYAVALRAVVDLRVMTERERERRQRADV